MNTDHNKMKVCGLEVQTVKKNIKNIHLGVYPPKGRVRVAAPLNTTDDSIRLFLLSKIPWIKKQKRQFGKQQRQTKREFVSGESHYFFGERYRLNVLHTNEKPRVEIKNKTHINLHVKSGMSKDSREKILERFYRGELRKQIPPILKNWQEKIGVDVTQVYIKKMKTKWGSCNSKDRRIWVNLELAKNSINCLEYVLVHEMTHILEEKHTDRFINLMDSLMPKWPQHKDILNNTVLGYFKWEHN